MAEAVGIEPEGLTERSSDICATDSTQVPGISDTCSNPSYPPLNNSTTPSAWKEDANEQSDYAGFRTELSQEIGALIAAVMASDVSASMKNAIVDRLEIQQS
jgi:hypothetical protein